MTSASLNHPRLAGTAVVLAALVLALSACSSSARKTASSAPVSAAVSSPSPSASMPSAAAGVATVTAQGGPLGTHLTDAAGHTLYLFLADTGGTSACTGSCPQYWPPLDTTGTPVTGTGVQAAKLGTITRADGSHQVTYDGHPLYTYVADSAAGMTNGQGANGFGAYWWVVAPSGSPITSAPAASSSTPYSRGGGNGY